jgi:beta-lactamase regulating signal transducer with metallopeptidase domain
MTANISNWALVMLQTPELSIVVKATAVVLMALVAARLASRARAAVRHVLLASAFAALLALPLVAVSVPALAIDIPIARPTAATPWQWPSGTDAPVAVATSEQPPTNQNPLADTSAWPAAAITRMVWLGGVMLCLAPLVVMMWRLRSIRRTGLPFAPMLSLAIERETARRVEFLQHEDVAAPMTFGLFRPVVVVPSDALDWSPADLRRALVHELEHVRRSDWAVHVLGRLVCAVYWFHPLVWVAGRQLSLEAERAADDAVVASSESTDYAEQLVVLAQRLSAGATQPLLGMANRSDLSARVTALLDSTQRRGRAGSLVAAGAIGLAAVVVVGVAPLTAVARVEAAVVAESQPPAEQATAKKVTRAPRPRALDRALLEAVETGDLEEVNEIIAAGANVNAAIHGDGSALIVAAKKADMRLVRRLIDAGADVNLGVEGDGSPLIQAGYRGRLDIASLLLDEGADVNKIVPGDENALMCASEGGHLAVVQLLVQRGANVNERIWNERGGDRPGEWRTAVSQASKNGHTAVVNFLKSAGARK